MQAPTQENINGKSDKGQKITSYTSPFQILLANHRAEPKKMSFIINNRR